MSQPSPHLRVVPTGHDQAAAFVTAWHRHHRPPPGELFTVGAALDDTLVGVAITGRPVARAYQDGLTVEVTRVATDGTRNACSLLYGASWRTAKARGFVRALTYTRDDETGASLRAAAWWQAEHRAARAGWDVPSRRRDNGLYDPIGRFLWVVGAWVRDDAGRLVAAPGLGLPGVTSRPVEVPVGRQIDLFDLDGAA